MTTPLPKNLVAVFCMSLIGLIPQAEAKWSISKYTDTSTKNYILVKDNKVKTHFVQIFSSINATKAQGMKNTLTMHGYPALINIKARHRQHYYQVQVGPFSSMNLARNAKSSIVMRYPQFSFLNDAILRTSLPY